MLVKKTNRYLLLSKRKQLKKFHIWNLISYRNIYFLKIIGFVGFGKFRLPLICKTLIENDYMLL